MRLLLTRPSGTLPSMRLLLFALLAGCIASADAQTVEPDVLTLSSGERITGELLDVRDGKYWVLRTDGQIVSLDFRLVQAVVRGGASIAPVPVEDLPLPSWNTPRVRAAERPIMAGFDFGFTTGVRGRFNTESPAVSHVDIKAGVSPILAGSFGPVVHTGVEVAFFGASDVHLTLGASVGGALIWGSFYPFAGAGMGADFDLRGPFEVHVGAQAGIAGSYFAFVPELTGSWMW